MLSAAERRTTAGAGARFLSTPKVSRGAPFGVRAVWWRAGGFAGALTSRSRAERRRQPAAHPRSVPAFPSRTL